MTLQPSLSIPEDPILADTRGTHRHKSEPIPGTMPQGGAKPRVLVVDDESGVRDFVSSVLQRSAYDTGLAADGSEALHLLHHNPYDLVITDLRMPRMSGIALLKEIKSRWPQTDVMMFSGHATIEGAVEAIKLGAYDYLTKPFNLDELLLKVQHCFERRALERETKRLSAIVSLSELSRMLTSNLDIESLPGQIVGIVQSSFQPDRACLALNTGVVSDTHVVVESSNGNDEREGSLVGVRPNELPFSIAEEQDGSTISVPLHRGDRQLGTLRIVRNNGQPDYRGEEGQLLALFGAQIAIALENAVAYRDLSELNLAAITALVTAVETRDAYTGGHSDRIAKHATRLARRLKLGPSLVEDIRIAALLHDIGKIGVSDLVLNKPGTLTHEEFEQVKRHPGIGAQIVGAMKPLQNIVPLIYHHHEQHDGSGYPEGLDGESIPLGARIIAVVDAFEAMTSDRAYRSALQLDESVRRLREGAGKQWDATLVEEFLRLVRHGTVVISPLSSHKEARSDRLVK